MIPPYASAAPGQAPSRMDLWLMRRMLQAMGRPPLLVSFDDGSEIREFDGPPVGRMRIHDPGVVRSLPFSTDLALGEAYTNGRIELEGDMLQIADAAFRAGAKPSRLQRTIRALRAWRPLGNTLRRARPRAQRHYDVGNDFYRLWLDEQLVYTCAYFESPELSLEAAQTAKLEHVCRKLRLRAGERVVEAGCGWGALALHMAEHHGVQVRAFNVSREQLAWARGQAKRRGLAGRVEFVDDDYRNTTGRFDAFVSVGMLEHVGRSHYPALAGVIARSLEPHGRGLLHSIGRRVSQPMSPWIERYIFPGAYIPSLREMLGPVEAAGLAVLDVENLRLHYARTLEHWLERFEKNAGCIEEMFDDRFVRMWRLYLVTSIASFRSDSCQLFQILFARGGWSDSPWTRAHLHPDPGAARSTHG